jgi:protein ImuB
MEALRTAPAIEMAVQKLLETICQKLSKQCKGLRKAVLTAHRMDGTQQQIQIGTHATSCSTSHLFKLFALQIPRLRPDLGFELFILEAFMLEDTVQDTQVLWNQSATGAGAEIAELLDTITNKTGQGSINRYMPQEHYWPERSVKPASSLIQAPVFKWPTDRPRPINLLSEPQKIYVTAPVPDYPPMLFRYQGTIHNVVKADGPERIEQEWWIQAGLHRDYYVIEDHQGARYWIFRLGHYGKDLAEWFIHGFFS